MVDEQESVRRGEAAAALSRGERVQDYLWSDLLCYRAALGLTRDVLAGTLDVDLGAFAARERGKGQKAAGVYMVDELLAMLGFVEQEAAGAIAAAIEQAGPPAEDNGTTVVLKAVVDAPEFEKTYPHAKTVRDGMPYPFTLHYVALGRAAAELTRRGYAVEVYRGDFRADLAVRRAGVGLPKAMTAELLGLSEKRYHAWETGKKSAPKSVADAAPAPVPAGLIRELQEMDDFITESAESLETVQMDGFEAVLLIDDQMEFELAYPAAKTLREATPYPLRLHRVAAARRARQIGAQARIVTIDDQGAIVMRPDNDPRAVGEQAFAPQFDYDVHEWRNRVYGLNRSNGS